MSILITGGTGWVGTGLAHRLVERGEDVILFDIAPQIERVADIKNNLKVVQGDQTDWPAVLNVVKENNVEVPEVICDDIHNLSGKDLMERIGKNDLDVMFGGVVCKGFSLATVRSSTDPRNVLYRKYISLAEEMQPKVVIIENVPGMASMKSRTRPWTASPLKSRR